MPVNKYGTGYEYGRVGSHNDTYHQGEGEAGKHSPGYDEQDEGGHEGCERGYNGSGENLVDGDVHRLCKGLTLPQPPVLPYSVEHDDGIVDRVTDYGEYCRYDRQRNVHSDQSQKSNRDQGIVGQSYHCSHSPLELESVPDVEDYEDHVEELTALDEKQKSEAIIRPGRFRILPDHTFRQSKPAVVGVEVEGGIIKTRLNVMKEDGTRVGIIKGIQEHSENVGEARFGSQVAVSIIGPVVGRQIKEEELLYIDIPEKHAKIVEQELYDTLSTDERETLEDFLEIKRKGHPFWGK